MEYYSVLKKNEIMSFVEAWKELEIIILRQIPYDIAYMWNLKYDTNEYIYKKINKFIHRKQTYGS